VRLTMEVGVGGWTLRQLAREIGAYPAVVYHHIGDREKVVAAVLHHVNRQLPVPPPDLPWREWFLTALTGARSVLRGYPGCARLLSLPGDMSGGERCVDASIRKLVDAGFGRESLLALHTLMTVAFQFVAMEDDLDTSKDTRQELAVELAPYREKGEKLPGLALVGEFASTFTGDTGLAEDYYTRLYEYTIERCLDGLERRLEALRSERPH
jgi:AcrR family transcriptional regulator